MEPSPAARVRRLSNSVHDAAIVRAAAELGLADAVGEEPTPVAEIAKQVGAEPKTLARLMRALVAYDIFEQVTPDSYRHSDMSRTMRSDAPGGLIHTLLTPADWGWVIWSKLADAVRAGKTLFPDNFGTDFFGYLKEHPEAQARMFRGMTSWSDAMNPKLVQALPLEDARTVADMGGGEGTLLRAILEQGPHLSGVWFDTEATLAVVDDELLSGPVGDRCAFVTGDYFNEVPFAADLYVFKLTLHMYEDDDAERILRNVAASARPGARIIIADPLLQDPPQSKFVPSMDLHMLLVMGGKERTEQDYADLFERSGLKFDGITPTGTDLHLAVARVPG
ncbi:methyltransferase [Nonomuraea sp. MG754425]|uniref:acetylserotonin O-methyltransferase n=1 Tax=Nonomuraea sp. MG754425 TaxID=2570319 RepID=UPI001F34CFE2|nr:acetylserotonin O-methyltransferase [Nonomuraea sp. MG754425]MCF6470024.1 methyltransferase [Nonomuraea sp. MG754425]